MAALAEDSRLRGNDLNNGDDSDNGDDSKIGNDSLLQVIGAGPASMGLVLALCNRIAADAGDSAAARDLLETMLIFEATDQPGGKMAQYRINANTNSPDVVQGFGFNILPDREPRGEPGFNGGIHGFQSYPLAIAPPIIDRLIANLPMEASS